MVNKIKAVVVLCSGKIQFVMSWTAKVPCITVLQFKAKTLERVMGAINK